MKTLFDKNERFTKEAQNIEDEILPTLSKTYDKYVKLGFSRREIEYVMLTIISGYSLMKLLDAPLKEEDEEDDDASR